MKRKKTLFIALVLLCVSVFILAELIRSSSPSAYLQAHIVRLSGIEKSIGSLQKDLPPVRALNISHGEGDASAQRVAKYVVEALLGDKRKKKRKFPEKKEITARDRNEEHIEEDREDIGRSSVVMLEKTNEKEWMGKNNDNMQAIKGMETEEDERLQKSPYIYKEDIEIFKYSRTSDQVQTKYISYYLPWEMRQHKYRFTYCKFQNCAFVDEMSKADLVVFFATDIRDHVIPKFFRPKGQRWLMHTMDPATRRYDLTRADAKAQFNLTMTYQLDSDLPLIFGQLKRQQPQSKDYDRLFEQKTGLATWFVSHCRTWGKRENYVKRMEAVMDMDIYGSCGTLSCGSRFNKTNVCMSLLTSKYKFYLAFENSFCPDYITEKFFKVFKGFEVIPVVRGGFAYRKYLPSGVYVDAADFESPEDLAEYLVRLGNDKQRYIDMLRRKDRWTTAGEESSHCRVCEYLHRHPEPPGHYENLDEKFIGQPPSCWSPKDF